MAIDLQECDSCEDVVYRYPRVATASAILIGGLTYAILSVLMLGTLNLTVVVVFAVLFGVGYTGITYFSRGKR